MKTKIITLTFIIFLLAFIISGCILTLLIVSIPEKICLAAGEVANDIEFIQKENAELKLCLKKIPLHLLAQDYVLNNSTEEQRNKWMERFKDENKTNQYLLDYFFDHKNNIKKEEWTYTAFLLWYCHNILPNKVKDYLKENDEKIKRSILSNDEIKFKD